MRAVCFVPHPDGARPEIVDLPKPLPAPGEVLVKVHAAGLNRGEMTTRRALTSGMPQQTGIEFAGEIIEPGPGANRFAPGERVMGHWKGGQAEYVTVDERLLVKVPQRLSWVEAGAWLNVFVTAHDAIVTNAQLKAGESVLITAASSGIGVAALQIARLLGAQPVIGSSRSAAKLEALKACGMQVGVLADGGFAESAAKATDKRGVDVLIDNIGGAALKQNLEALALKGRFVSVGRLASDTAEINLDYVALRRLQLIGVTFRTRTKEERIACVQRCAADLWAALDDGRLNPVVYKSFPMSDIAAAHACMERDEHIGKIVIEIA